MQPIDSSLLQAAAHHAQSAILELAFRSGAVYHYFDVPSATYHELLGAESKGKYFNSHIRNRFVCSKCPIGQARLESMNL